MIKNSVYYELFASIQVPNPDEVGYWIDLGADSQGRIIKTYNKNIGRWVKVIDAGSEDAASPFIGSNGNWWVDNRDTGIPAAGKNPYIGEDNYWYVYVPLEKQYVNTGIMAKGLSAYEIAVKYGFKGTEEEWVEYLRKPALDAAITALDAADKANKATDDAKEATAKADVATENAQNAANRSNEIADNPPKIVNEEWYMYDELTKEYKPTGIKAIGDPFEIKKTYKSVAEMEADYDNPMIGVGQFVWINTGDVEDPDDSKLYLKGTDNWILVGDLSGSQGIQGISAYQVAVQEGFVGTQAEWIQSLKQPALDAAEEALDAKAQIEATEVTIKEAEAARVVEEGKRVAAETIRETDEATRKTNESGRVSAEATRVSTENARIASENIRNSNEDTRKSNETTRISNENTRQTNETARNTKEDERIANETGRVAAESTRVTQETNRKDAEDIRVTNESARIAAEATRKTAEDTRISNEADREANEAIRETQESERQTNTAAAITAVNEAKTAAQTATTNANTAATSANTQANRAKEYSDNPPKIENDKWFVWDETNKVYVDTGVLATGEPGKTPIIQNGTWWVYNNDTSSYEDTLISVTSQYELTKAKIESVLTGEIKSHHHDSFYYTETEIDQKLANVNNKFDSYLGKDNATEYIPTDDYNPSTKKYVDSEIIKVNTELDTKVDKSIVGTANGIAQLDLTGKVPASQLPSFVDDVLEYDTYGDFPLEGETGKIYIAIDTNMTYRWSGTQYTMIASSLALGETSSTAYPGDKGKANADKLATIESGAQVNVIESVSARGADLPITNKRVIVPEDIAISDTEPTGDELIWINTAEDYLFEFGGYTKEDADAKFVVKETGKGLSTNDFTNEEKSSLANKLDTVTKVGDDGNVVSNLAKLGTELRVYKTTVLTESAADAKYSTITDMTSAQNNIATKIDSVNVTGTGNVITGATKSGTAINLTKNVSVLSDVPADAKFTDTVYDDSTVKADITSLENNKAETVIIPAEINDLTSTSTTDEIFAVFGGLDKLTELVEKIIEQKYTFVIYDKYGMTLSVPYIAAESTGNSDFSLTCILNDYGSNSLSAVKTIMLQVNNKIASVMVAPISNIYFDPELEKLDGACVSYFTDNNYNGQQSLAMALQEEDVVPEAPSDNKQYARMNKTWVEVESMPMGETVKITVTSNQAQPDASIIGATITVVYGDNTKTMSWEGAELSTDIPVNMSYTITCSPIEGYATPPTQTYIALAGNTRTVTLSYNTTITTINVTSNQSAANFTNAVNVTISGGFTKALTGALSYTVKIPTGVSYNVTGSAVTDTTNNNYKKFITPSTSAKATGTTQTIELQYKATSVQVTIRTDEQTARQNFTLTLKRQSDNQVLKTFSGSTPNEFTLFIDDVTNANSYVFSVSDIVNYITPASQTLSNLDGTARLVTLEYTFLSEQVYAYWVIFDESKSTTTLERGGNAEIRDAIRAKFKRCMAMPQANGKAAIAYLSPDDSKKWADGSNSPVTVINAGKHVMVHFPKYYYRNEDLGNSKYKLYISDRKINDNYKEEKECLIGTFEAYVYTNKLGSFSGVSSSNNLTITQFYNYAQTNGSKWGLIDYRAHKTIANMFAIMYGNTNISTQNSNIPCSGGNKPYNNGNTGGTLALGDRDGCAATNGYSSTQSSNFLGLEDCYYSKWEFVQGINVIDRQWIAYDGGLLVDTSAANLSAAGFTNVRTMATGGSSDGYITKISHGPYADVVPMAIGGSDTTYYADYYYQNTGNRILLRSGASDNGSVCGVFFSAAYASSYSYTDIGSRLGFYGDIEVKTPAEWTALSPDFNG